MQKHPRFFLGLIILVAILAAVFVYPKGWGAKYRPWRLGLDLVGGTHLVYEVDLSTVANSDRSSVLAGLRDVLERRVNLFGVSEPQVYVAQSGDTSDLVVELAGIRDVSQAIKLIGETPFLEFREQSAAATGTSTDAVPTFVPTKLSGRYITGAQLTYNQNTGQPEVSLSFNTEGAQLFEDITGRNVGKRLAIFLDNELISAPNVNGKISGGQAQITNITAVEAKQLVERLNAGALPAPIKLVNQQTIDPSLGSNSLKTGVAAGIAGTILVIIFMIAYYHTKGIFASLALIIYIFLTLALFKLIPITLTLAGLAGFVLTIGMAVDANVLIFERIKEEQARGVSPAAALREGFHRAWPSIRDSNVSTLITAAILYIFTSGFVKGFALTLFLGVVVSMFSAITTTRLFLLNFTRTSKAAVQKTN